MLILVCLAPPFIYFTVSHRAERASLETEAEIIAAITTNQINANPLYWRYEQHRLEDAMQKSRSARMGEERVRILSSRGDPITSIEVSLPEPVMSSVYPVFDSGKPVGQVEISRSFRAQVNRTLLIGSLSILLGGIAFIVIRGVPIAALRTAMKRLEEEKEKAQVTLNSIGDGVLTTDSSGKVVMLNPAAETLIGLRQEEAEGRPVEDVLKISPIEGGHTADEIVRRILGGADPEQRVDSAVLLTAGGDQLVVSIHGAGIHDASGNVDGAVLALQDITESRMTQEQLKLSLMEKEVLLKEVHHRVKNNLQVISGLLNLQSNYIKDESVRRVFKDSQGRIKTMALIHEGLYQREQLAQIDCTDYIQKLATNILGSYFIEKGRVQLSVNVDHSRLPLDTIIPCGLIINELVSNAAKHAFPNNREGVVRIELNSTGKDTFYLEVGDNGVGFPEGLDFRNTNTLGMQLAVILTEQLGGEITMERNNGTTFGITFREYREATPEIL